MSETLVPIERVCVPGFEAMVLPTPEGITIRLVGELDVASYECLAKLVDRVAKVEGLDLGVVAVDLGELSFADLYGLRAVADACQRLSLMGWSVRASNPRANVERVAQFAGVTLPF